jgi:hypothetical protein
MIPQYILSPFTMTVLVVHTLSYLFWTSFLTLSAGRVLILEQA